MIKKVAFLCVALMLATILISGCLSSSTNPSPSTSALGQMGTKPTTQAKTSPTVLPTTPTPTPKPVTLNIAGPSTIAEGIGGTWVLYINGQLPTLQQATHIAWYGAPSGTTNPPRELGPPGSWSIDANGAANTFPGTYTLTATYKGVSTSFTVTRVANPTFTPTATPTPFISQQ